MWHVLVPVSEAESLHPLHVWVADTLGLEGTKSIFSVFLCLLRVSLLDGIRGKLR